MDQINLLEKEKAANAVFWKHIAVVLLGSLFLALMSQIRFFLPFTPVPMTLQTFAVFFLAGVLGKKRAVGSVIAYLTEATIGLPVLSFMKMNNFWFIELSAGYLFGFILAAYVIGALIERLQRPYKMLPLFIIFFLGNACILSCGYLWLASSIGFHKAWIIGIAPFILSGSSKVLAATFAVKGYSLVFHAPTQKRK